MLLTRSPTAALIPSSRRHNALALAARTPRSINLRHPSTPAGLALSRLGARVPRVAQVDTAVPQAQDLLDLKPQPHQSTKPFTWTRTWYPVMPIDSTDPTRPHPMKLLGKDMVLWRDGAGEWRCFQDACPHRLAPLSEGRIDPDGTLMCSYHGWKFNSTGACTSIPQAEDAKTAAAACSNKRSCVTSYPLRQAAGLLWVWPDASPSSVEESAATEPVVPDTAKGFLEAGGYLHWYMRELPYGYETLVENLSDPAHLPFSHHKLSPALTRAQGGSMPMRPTKADGDQGDKGGVALLLEETFPSHNSPKSLIQFYSPGMIVYEGEFESSADVKPAQHTLLWAVPVAPGVSRVISAVFTLPFAKVGLFDVIKARGKPEFKITMGSFILNKLPTWQRHLFSNKLFDQDSIFLAQQEQRLRAGTASASGSGAGLADWSKSYYMPTSSDRAMIQARRWIESNGGGPFGLGGGYAPAGAANKTRREMMDRYEQHTKHCTACKTKLKELEATAARLPIVGAVLFFALCALVGSVGIQGIVASGWPRIAAAAVGVGLAACVALYKQAQDLIPQFHYVEFFHADNH